MSNNVFTRAFQRALEGDPLDDVDDAFLKLSAFQQRMRDTEEYNGIAQFAQSMLSGVKHAGYYLNDSGKQGKSGFLTRKLDVDVEGMKRFLEKYGTTRNIFFTAVMACTLSRLSGQEDVAFGFIDNGRDRFNSFDAIGLYINGLPLLAHVDQQNMKAFLEKLSDTYYKLVKYNYYPFTPMTHQFIAGPVILFQFLPDWITEDDNYYSIPLPDAVVNKIISRMGNFEMEALIDLVEKGDRYMIRIIYSGYYSRKHVEILAETYEATLSQLIHA